MSTASKQSKRRMGREVKAAAWATRHPAPVAVPAAIGTELAATGSVLASGGVLGASVVAMTAWCRTHPASFDTLAAPLLRGWRRRWMNYLGWRWANALEDCGLTRQHRKSGERLVPRITRVRAHSPSVDTVYVKILPGQHARQFEAVLPELADALGVQRVAVERVKPRVIALVVERSEPFTEIIDAPDMPFDPDAVDLDSVYVGETEHGHDWREPAGGHLLVSGATGAGKNSVIWSQLRALAPLIRDGMIRIWVADPKRMEFSRFQTTAYRYAADEADCLDMIEDFVESMQQAQQLAGDQGKRKTPPSVEAPWNILICDEIGTLLAYGDAQVTRGVRKLLALVGSQGRAVGYWMWGTVQEPSKDVVTVRDLFNVRICLRVTTASHVDMVLGDGARERGALADEIPPVADTAGIGYVIRKRSRAPMRVRAAYVTDAEIDALADFITTPPANSGGDEAGPAFRVVA